MNESEQLADLLTKKSDLLLQDWLRKARPEAAISRSEVESLLQTLVQELRGQSAQTAPLETSPALATVSLSQALEAILADTNALRTELLEFAQAHGVGLQGAPLETINRVVDGAMARAVTQVVEAHADQRKQTLASAVHDLRTPLTALSLAAQLLDRLVSPEPDTEERALLDIVRSNVDKQNQLFGHVLSL